MSFPVSILLVTQLVAQFTSPFAAVNVFAQTGVSEAEDSEARPNSSEAEVTGTTEAPVPSAQSAFAANPSAGTSDSRISVAIESTQDVQEVLKSIVSNYQSKLKDLEPWQKRLYADEVIPQYSRFIKDYRMNGNVVQVEIDAESIKKFLAYHFNPKADKSKEMRIGVYVRASGDCVRCSVAVPKIKPLAVAKLERRGFIPVWVQPQDLRDLSGKSSGLQLTGKALEERVLQVTGRKGWSGALVIQLQNAANDPAIPDHAEDKRTTVRTSLMFREIVGGQKIEHQDGSIEVPESESVDPVVGRLLTDAFTDLGGKFLALGGSVATQDAGEEYALFVSGIRDFSVYQAVKTGVLERIQSIGTLEDRMFAKGKVQFSIRSTKPFAEIKAAISQVGLPAPYRYAFRGEGYGFEPEGIQRQSESNLRDSKSLRAEVQYAK